MKRTTRIAFYLFCTVAVISGLAGSAVADTYVFNLGELGDLDHSYAYASDIYFSLDDSHITEATLYFDNIWDSAPPGILYVDLLEDPLGWVRKVDYQNPTDYFEALGGYQLAAFTDIPGTYATRTDIELPFDADAIARLTTYLQDGNFALGFDPDCHFYNDGVRLVIKTPEPGIIMLLGIGLMGMVGLRRKIDK